MILGSPQVWDVAIGHYLGVDHASHMFKINSPEVERKLEQMDDEISAFLQDLMDNEVLKEYTILLLVMGDHGMTLSGEHGGGSKEEVETVLVAVDVENLRQFQRSSDQSLCLENLEVVEMDQMDLAVSLSFLMDVPVPYGNIGKVSPVLLGMRNNAEFVDWATAINAWQVCKG